MSTEAATMTWTFKTYSQDREVQMIELAIQIFDRLDPEAYGRVIDYLGERYVGREG